MYTNLLVLNPLYDKQCFYNLRLLHSCRTMSTCTNPNGKDELVVPSDAVLNLVLQSMIISRNWQEYLYACAALDSPT